MTVNKYKSYFKTFPKTKFQKHNFYFTRGSPSSDLSSVVQTEVLKMDNPELANTHLRNKQTRHDEQ